MTEQVKPGYLFQASMQIGECIAITLNGNLPFGADAKVFEAEFDRVLSALEKQQLKRMKIPAVKGALQDQKDALARGKKLLEELAFQEQGRKLGTAERAQQDTTAKQIATLSDQVAKGEEILAALEKEAA